MRKRMGAYGRASQHWRRLRHSTPCLQLLSGLDFLENYRVCRHSVPEIYGLVYNVLGEARSFTCTIFLCFKTKFAFSQREEFKKEEETTKVENLWLLPFHLITQTAYFGLCLGSWKESYLLQVAGLSYTSLVSVRKFNSLGTSLVVQWARTCLVM